MKLLIKNQEIEVINATSFKLRFLGLMGQKTINKGLFFPNCNSIHTFFMKDRIDVLMMDDNNKIIFIHENLPKNKIIYHKKAKNTLELPKNTINNLKIKINDHIKIVN